MTTETIDDVLKDVYLLCEQYDNMGAGHAAAPIRSFAKRIRAAHMREVTEWGGIVAEILQPEQMSKDIISG